HRAAAAVEVDLALAAVRAQRAARAVELEVARKTGGTRVAEDVRDVELRSSRRLDREVDAHDPCVAVPGARDADALAEVFHVARRPPVRGAILPVHLREMLGREAHVEMRASSPVLAAEVDEAGQALRLVLGRGLDCRGR